MLLGWKALLFLSSGVGGIVLECIAPLSTVHRMGLIWLTQSTATMSIRIKGKVRFS